MVRAGNSANEVLLVLGSGSGGGDRMWRELAEASGWQSARSSPCFLRQRHDGREGRRGDLAWDGDWSFLEQAVVRHAWPKNQQTLGSSAVVGWDMITRYVVLGSGGRERFPL